MHIFSSNPRILIIRLEAAWFTRSSDIFISIPATVLWAFLHQNPVGVSERPEFRAVCSAIHEPYPKVNNQEFTGKAVSRDATDLPQNEQQPSDHTDLRTSKTMKTSTRFWDNKSLLCVRERNDDDLNTSTASEEKAMDFNPAVDAMNAFRIATLIVFGLTVLTIGGLSKRWELDGWEDWRIFIQSGHLGKLLIPENWSQSASQAIPDRLRPTPVPLSEQELLDELELISSWSWKKRVDREWEVERNRREAERLQWEAQRKALGKKIW
ncbi:hypothetical protein PGTUg99_026524 [Puccinia graminis f. sp. tritici]|uniref:Uncharacterized protein n=1 Tax=Puccinia graminis f. sp. tritici TaxID=56615 RepID=A0A5B0Q7S3_PUCGR|nr:hypothetical protein PGTUg99_026524 [Puccinia graminis f. sp. tritici]